MSEVVPLFAAEDTALFGSKAVDLGQALRDGLPVPPGVALAGAVVDAVAGRDEAAIARVAESVATLHGPLAVRSSAVDEDGADASFAGQHLTLLNVRGARELTVAVSEVWWSATPTRPSPTASAWDCSRARAWASSSRRSSIPRPPE